MVNGLVKKQMNLYDFPTRGFGLIKASSRVLSNMEFIVCQHNHENGTTSCKVRHCDVTLVGDITNACLHL